ncbi:TVP38/TMEM64 family protein [Bacteriovorax sp. DB6_IX]|uniref:TVP38/TMEM64 family protein n=1 Tax=Bacteriovorax sp. DB6_IX TaxID=1353530 RepID=UPI00038A0B89|nr:VTT domain-containing protein [Bacteriovorax sp. DB6_IX]EQC52422.1 SNARE-like domain protein [Bacteriovorax sp. DB6_IX]
MRKIILIITFFVILFILAELTGLRQIVTIDYLQSLFVKNIFISSTIFILLFSAANLIQIPGWIFLVAAITSLGKFYGPLLTYLAAVISCLVSFYLVNYLGKDALKKIKNRFIIKTLDNLDHTPIKSMLILRLVFQTFPPVNYALALSGVQVRDYLIACILGLPLPIIVLTIFFEIIFGRFL